MIDSHEPADQDSAGGWLALEQLAWINGVCSADDPRPLVVCLHHHPLALHAPWLDRMVLRNGEALHAILVKARARLRGVFYGHMHESVATVRDGVAYYSAQSGWFQTRTWYGQEMPARDPVINPGFNLVTLTETDTFVRFCRVGWSEGYSRVIKIKMKIMSGEDSSADHPVHGVGVLAFSAAAVLRPDS